MLVFDGFKYVMNRESQKNIFWRCSRYVRFGCRAGAVTSKSASDEQTIRLTHTHSHAADKIYSNDYDEYVKVDKV
jgi:FLYWCH zinc finger domain